MIFEANIYWHEYSYFAYERNFAEREVVSVLNPEHTEPIDNGIHVRGNIRQVDLDRLVYFDKYQHRDEVGYTLQSRLESSYYTRGRQRKQSTRYSVHGLHEYKGKFNPQIVRGILNILGISEHSRILDPFCGSGTSLVECAYANMKAKGIDMNPLAVFISNAKIQALSTPADHLQAILHRLFKRMTKRGIKSRTPSTEREVYLCQWFERNIFETIETLRETICAIAGFSGDIFLTIASDLLREYSLQEPADLRIRRRKSPMPSMPFLDAFFERADRFIKNLTSAQAIVGLKGQSCCAYHGDNRIRASMKKVESRTRLFDAAITSPPYATALPYIDTQRLSIVWLDLCDLPKLKELEATLTGSREYIGNKGAWNQRMIDNVDGLPVELHSYCLTMFNSLSSTDGFRRQAVPGLLYRYLTGMRDTFLQVGSCLRDSAPFALVVGHNHTTLGGRRFNIDTPDLLRRLAIGTGWRHEESIPLQTYRRYSLHSKNAVSAETLLILRNNA